MHFYRLLTMRAAEQMRMRCEARGQLTRCVLVSSVPAAELTAAAAAAIVKLLPLTRLDFLPSTFT